jgi:hypothetical protein
LRASSVRWRVPAAPVVPHESRAGTRPGSARGAGRVPCGNASQETPYPPIDAAAQHGVPADAVARRPDHSFFETEHRLACFPDPWVAAPLNARPFGGAHSNAGAINERTDGISRSRQCHLEKQHESSRKPSRAGVGCSTPRAEWKLSKVISGWGGLERSGARMPLRCDQAKRPPNKVFQLTALRRARSGRFCGSEVVPA